MVATGRITVAALIAHAQSHSRGGTFGAPSSNTWWNASLGVASAHWMAIRSVQLFLQGSQSYPTDRQTLIHGQTTECQDMRSNRPLAMRPNNNLFIFCFMFFRVLYPVKQVLLHYVAKQASMELLASLRERRWCDFMWTGYEEWKCRRAE